jgi:hypothetical protein
MGAHYDPPAQRSISAWDMLDGKAIPMSTRREVLRTLSLGVFASPLRSLAVARGKIRRAGTLPRACTGSRRAWRRCHRHCTANIPIVFAIAGDLVGNGPVRSLGHPGGNATGLLQADQVIE